MAKTLKDIIQNSSDLYQIKVDKPSGNEKFNHTTWKFKMVDSRWTDESFKDYMFRPVFLRRGNGFFLAYKSDESNAYFVDPKRSMYRNSVKTYVNGLVDYSVKTNDISFTKDQPSFRITYGEMKNKKIDNFLDLCFNFRDYTAIGTGYTRDVRNLVVLDIDVDCTKPDNVEEINNLLFLFARHKSLPDFYIFNKKSKHIQLQWVIKDLHYKEINNEIIENLINELNNETNKNREMDNRKIDFTDISQDGIKYRRYTMALCDIVKKRKFGDKHYTFWKAKNPMSALIQIDGLELKMPYYEDGEIKFKTDEEMNLLFFTKEARKMYFDMSPTLDEWYSKIKDFMDPLVEKVSEKKILKMDDATDVTEIKEEVKTERRRPADNGDFGESRNTFVMRYTKYVTKELAKKYGYRNKEDFSHVKHEVYNAFKNEVFELVWEEFQKRDKGYGGIWPDTTNITSFTNKEFKQTFNSSFTYITSNNNDTNFTDDHRKHSQLVRKYKKDIKLIVVDRIRRSNTKITRKKLLEEVNTELKKLMIKKTTMGSLKRFIAESNELTDDERTRLYDTLIRQKEWVESRTNS